MVAAGLLLDSQSQTAEIVDVVEKRLLVTRVRTIKNVEVTVPNGLVMTNHILNYSTMAAESGLIVHTTVSLGYDIPWRKVHETLIAAALATAELNAATDQPSHLVVITSELHQNIQDFCARAGIEILSPHYGALRDGNESTVPETPQSKDSPHGPSAPTQAGQTP